MSQADMLSINAVAAKLGLSVHQLRRWELMFGLEIKRGRGQQRQYRSEDMSVLERIKELVEQGWPTSQIRPQLEAEGLVTPKLIGLPPPPGNPEVLSEALIGFRNFTERRFIEISRQIDELRQLLISITLKQELQGEPSSPWQPVQREFAPEPKAAPPQEISIGPDYSVGPPVEFTPPPPPPPPPQRTSIIGAPAPPKESTFEVGPSTGSLPSTSFSSTPGAPERRSVIGEPNAPPPPPPPSPSTSIGMTEEEADALLEEEDFEEEEVTGEKEEITQPPASPVEPAKIEETLDEEDEEEEEEAPPPQTPTITAITSSSPQLPATAPPAPPVMSSSAFSPVGSEPHAGPEPVEPPAPPAAPADPFKSSPFLSTPPAVQEPPATPPAPPPEPPKPVESSSIFAPAPPTLTPSAAGDMFTSVVQSASESAREQAPEPPPAPTPPEPSFPSTPPPPPPPPPGPGVTPFTPPAPDSSPFIPTPSSTSSSPFLTPPPQPYVTGPAPTPPPQPFEPPAPPPPPEPEPAPPAPPEPPKAPAAPAQKGPCLGEITDQNYLTILGRALDLVGWSDEQADSFSVSRFKVPHWDELGRSQAEVLIEHLLAELQSQMNPEG